MKVKPKPREVNLLYLSILLLMVFSCNAFRYEASTMLVLAMHIRICKLSQISHLNATRDPDFEVSHNPAK